jgi:3-dehydroquinate synthase
MVKIDLYRQLIVDCGVHQYPIYIGRDLLASEELLRQQVTSGQVCIVSNETIAPLYLKKVQNAFKGLQCDVVLLKDGEQYKNQQSIFSIFDHLINHHHHRDTTIFALGGGVVGDITGFAAATYQRGVKIIQLPTTLLAQVDSSVGGKTAINHPKGKNMIGSFYQPHAVIMDLTTLATLPAREYQAGFAEVVKYGLLVGGNFLERLVGFTRKELLSRDSELMGVLIADCCKIKAGIVKIDEKEMANRALLNLGHTFAHALEAFTKYKRWLHGEAVAIGLYCAASLSHQLGYLEKKYVDLVDELLFKLNLPRRIPSDIDVTHLQSLMFHDKKVQNDTLRLVLFRAPGDCYIDANVAASALHLALVSAVAGDNP